MFLATDKILVFVEIVYDHATYSIKFVTLYPNMKQERKQFNVDQKRQMEEIEHAYAKKPTNVLYVALQT